MWKEECGSNGGEYDCYGSIPRYLGVQVLGLPNFHWLKTSAVVV